MQAGAELIDIAFKRHAQDLFDTWQGKVLREALWLQNGVARPDGTLGAVALSVLAHSFDEALPILLRVCHPGYEGLGAPMLCSAGKISRRGAIMADVITKDGQKLPNQRFFDNSRAMEGAFRRLADKLKLEDKDREELFAALKRWVVCDYRLDPNMTRDDPDAKRFVVN